MRERVKEFDVSVNVSFNVSFQVLANNEATVDCHIHPSYDVFIDDVEAELNQLSYW